MRSRICLGFSLIATAPEPNETTIPNLEFGAALPSRDERLEAHAANAGRPVFSGSQAPGGDVVQ